MDALNGWQLVKELKQAAGLTAAASFKHVSPAGAALGLPLDETLKKIYWVEDMGELSPLACAYARARGADRMSSFGDFIALSDECDVATANLIKREVSDGVIAPGYEAEALAILKSKKNGNYSVIQIDPDYEPAAIERKQIFGITFEQGHNNLEINRELLRHIVTENRKLPDSAELDLILSPFAMQKADKPLASAQDSSPGYIVPGWQEVKRITGICASPPRCLAFPLRTGSSGLIGIMPLMFILGMIIWTCCLRAGGKRYLR